MALVAVGLAVALAWLVDYVRRQQAEGQLRATQEAAERVLSEARTEAETVRKEAELQGKEFIIQAKAEFEQEVKEQRRDIQQTDKHLLAREETLDRRTEQIDRRDNESKKREQTIKDHEQAITTRQAELDHLVDETRVRLEDTAGLTRDEARKQSLVDGG
jgi:ribonuclease Y